MRTNVKLEPLEACMNQKVGNTIVNAQNKTDSAIFTACNLPHGVFLLLLEKSMNADMCAIPRRLQNNDGKLKLSKMYLLIKKRRIITGMNMRPNDKNQYLLTSSCHPPECLNSIPLSLALGMNRPCMEDLSRRNLFKSSRKCSLPENTPLEQ